MCDIEDIVRKISLVFNILNPFCPRLSGDHFAQEHKTSEFRQKAEFSQQFCPRLYLV